MKIHKSPPLHTYIPNHPTTTKNIYNIPDIQWMGPNSRFAGFSKYLKIILSLLPYERGFP